MGYALPTRLGRSIGSVYPTLFKGNIMTYAEFIQECSSRTIHVSVAMENEEVKNALRIKDDDKVRELLDKLF